MIKSFKDKTTEQIFNSQRVKGGKHSIGKKSQETFGVSP